jgi:hypothetical protein
MPWNNSTARSLELRANRRKVDVFQVLDSSQPRLAALGRSDVRDPEWSPDRTGRQDHRVHRLRPQTLPLFRTSQNRDSRPVAIPICKTIDSCAAHDFGRANEEGGIRRADARNGLRQGRAGRADGISLN